MEDKLKVKVWNYKNVVMFEVLEQDESLRDRELEFRAKNGWKIESRSLPCLGTMSKILYIRGGEKTHDRDVSVSEANTIQRAKQLVKEIKQAVREFNESQKEILNEKEKEYLSAVIKPFRDEAKCIVKNSSFVSDKEFICITLKSDEDISLPYFKKDTMYKGMEAFQKYTLKELGL